MKIEALKKRLAKEVVIIGGVLAVMAAGAYYLSLVAEENAKNNNAVETELGNLTRETNELQAKFIKVQENADLYQMVLQETLSGKLTLNRKSLRGAFDKLKDRYLLGALKLTLSSEQPLGGAVYARQTNTVVGSEVSISSSPLTDEELYGLVSDLGNEIPGIIAFSSLSLRQTHPLNQDDLAKIRQEGSAGLLMAEVKFNWLGIKPVEKDDISDVSAKPKK